MLMRLQKKKKTKDKVEAMAGKDITQLTGTNKDNKPWNQWCNKSNINKIQPPLPVKREWQLITQTNDPKLQNWDVHGLET